MLYRKWLSSQNNKAANKAGTSRDELVKQAQDTYASASKSGGSNYASVTSSLASATDAAKDSTFDTWSDSELKSYLDSYGIPAYQGTTTNDLKAMVKKHATYFRYGTSTPGDTMFAKVQSFFGGLYEQVMGPASGQGTKAADYAHEKATAATHRAGEAAQSASDKVKEEL